MSSPGGFEVRSRAGEARTGILRTAHGAVETPAFMPVATLGAIKGLTVSQLRDVGATIMLSNLYHLTLRPGVEIIEELGGLHAFCGWKGPLLTDSGGYQVFSLARLAAVDDDGVSFRNHVDGERMRLTPTSVVDLQHRMGVDLAMVLDECPPFPVDHAAAARSLARTTDWARRARQAARGPELLFGIVQGSVYRDLREEGAAALRSLDFDGYAIGGVSVGEPAPERRAVVEWTAPALPAERPRYLMGVGTPADIAHAVARGVDLFDCVLPSRNGRHGVLFTAQGLVRIKNARYRDDPTPLADGVTSRAFLHHLFRAGEVTAGVLATLHNLRFYLDFMAELRKAIASETLADLVEETARAYPEEAISRAPSDPGTTSPATH